MTRTLSKVNPLTCFGLLAALGLAVSFVWDPAPVLVLHVALVALLLGAGLAPAEALRSHLLVAPFAIGVLMTNAVSRPGEVIAAVGPLEVTDEGLVAGAALAIRVFVVAVPAMAVARATDPTRLVTAMTQLRLSARAGFAVLTAHRMLAAMPAEWQALLDAGRVRAPLDRRGRPRLGVRGYGRAAFTLLVTQIRRGDRIADALEVRGVGSPSRTQRLVVPFTRVDALTAAAVTCLAAAALLVGATLS